MPEGRRFWSLRPFAASAPPPVRQRAWPSRRIDTYLLSRMEIAGLAPAPRADRRTLIRRACYDLTGLPPAPAEVAAFENDPAPDAYARLVERLLASPHYGERWGRHWLDLVRYCDVPESWAKTDAQPWRYRDWVVGSLNQDLPYDQFVKLQLAADETPNTAPADYAALGFIGLSPSYWKELKLAPDVIKTVVAEEWEERITAVTGTVLGLTVGCARCHDHKFDPITTQDYYALAGIFASTKQVARPLLPDAEAQAVMKAREQAAKLDAEAKRLRDNATRDRAHANELTRQAEAMEGQLAILKRNTPNFDAPMAYCVETASVQVGADGPDHTRVDWLPGQGQDVAVQPRGNPALPGPVVGRRFLEVLSPRAQAFAEGSGRRGLAEAMFREAAPLTARVIVNRVWRHHFGRGLVETPSNFGVQGDRPTHPELLDDLAQRFVNAGWSLKWLHREIMLSAAYQQSSRPSAKAMAADPDNRLLSRMNRRRLEVEAWRDGILAAAGTLDPQVGGAPQELRLPENLRRTLYAVVTRRELDDLLRLYDFPDPTAHSPARFATTTPLQQLYVLNSAFIGKQAAALAARVRKDCPDDLPGQVSLAHQLLFGRPATPRELELSRQYLERSGSPASDTAWNEYAEVLLARNELIFVD
jgi:hypothetical protein